MKELDGTGSVKGLFCSIPLQYVNHFAAFGLRVQKLTIPSSADSNWYHVPWYAADDTKVMSLDDLKSTTANDGILLFAKSSTPRTLDGLKSYCSEDLGCVVLCRVIIDKIKDIDFEASDDDIFTAASESYSALHSTAT